MWQVLGGLHRGTSPTLEAVDEVARMTSAVLAVGPKVTIPGLCVLMITNHIKAIWY